MSTSLSLLRQQRLTVLKGISNSEEQITILADKISRLRAASNILETSITYLRTTKSSIDNLEVDERSWKGKTKDNYENKYSIYRDSVQQYLSKAENAKEAIDSDIRRYESTQSSYALGLNKLQSTFHLLETQIRAKERE
ncbi:MULTISPECIES: DUF5082 family protein [Clostridia]|uniref:YwqH-like family protein n=1 Tax=Clostridia TaxID=186801 RepID=UPI0013142B86|nr:MULTISPECIES: DUF5082 family protein [Clostridia]